MNVNRIQPSDVMSIWPFLSRHLDKLLADEDKDYELAVVQKACVEGRMQLWVSYAPEGVNAVLVTEPVLYGRTPTLCLRWLAADDMHWVEFVHTLENWARAQGFEMMEFWGRKGWDRLMRPYGYKETFRIVQKRLSEEQLNGR